MPPRLPYKHLLDESVVAQDLRRVVTFIATLITWALSCLAEMAITPLWGESAWQRAAAPGHHVFCVASALSGVAMLYLTIKGSRPAAFRQFLWGVAIYAAVCLFLFGWFDEYYLAIYRDIDHNAGDLF